MHREQQKYDSLLRELDLLKEENVRLKKLLQANGIAYEVVDTNADEEKVYSDITFPDAHLGKDERVELFRSLFRGREDVFARRWYSKVINKGGYQPVCINEWRRGLCDKKAVKCVDCPNRNFLALGYDEICRHLIGNDENGCDVIGIYAIMPDNNCAFLCTDFDEKNCKHGYKDELAPAVTPEQIFATGCVWDAWSYVSQMVRSARQRIVLIDNFVDERVLTLLSKREKGVSATIHSRYTEQFKLDLEKHNEQYDPVIFIQLSHKSHDRFLIVVDDVYLMGASVKDMGTSLCAITKMEMPPDVVLSLV